MSMIDDVRKKMGDAMKAHDKARKDSLSMLLQALKNKYIDKGQQDLTEAEEFEVVNKEIRQTKETMEIAPEDRTDIKEECAARIKVYEEFAPAMMGEEEIRKALDEVLKKLGIDSPTAKDKGKIMKELMPAVKGKADGALVNKVVSGAMS